MTFIGFNLLRNANDPKKKAYQGVYSSHVRFEFLTNTSI